MCAKVLQQCLTLCNTMDGSLAAFSVHGILWARILDWVTVPFSRGTSQPKDQSRISLVSYTGRQVLYH